MQKKLLRRIENWKKLHRLKNDTKMPFQELIRKWRLVEALPYI